MTHHFSINRIRYAFFSLCILCLFISSAVQSQTRTWDGGGDGVNWGDANNWSSNQLPTTAANIPYGYNVTVNGNFNCSSITFTSTGSINDSSILVINSGNSLTLTGAITMNHLITGSATLSIQGTGSISVGSVSIGQTVGPFLNASGITKLISKISNFSSNGNLFLRSHNDSPDNANAAFSLQSGIFTLGGVVTPIVSPSTGQTAYFLMNEGDQSGTLVLSNSNPWDGDLDFETSSGWGGTSSGKVYNINLNGTNATVVYNRTGNQTINRARWTTSGSVDVTYRNLTLAGSGNKDLPSTSTSTITGTLSFQGTAIMTGTNPIYADGSTLEYKGSNTQTTTDFEFLSNASAPSNLVIDNTNGVTLHAAKTLRTTGVNSITLRNGVFNNGSFNVTMASGSTINRGGGSFQSLPLFPATVNLNYEQTGALITSALEVPTSTSVLSNLTIDNSNGVVFNRDATVNGTLTLSNGVLTLNSGYVMHIVSGNQIAGSGFGLLKHIITEKNSGTNSIAYIRSGAFTGSRTFPLGEGNYYMPATLSSAGANDFNVAVFSGAAINGQPNGAAFSNLSPIVNANWIINRNSGTSATDITFAWSESLEGASFGIAADNQIGISRYDGTSWDPITGINGDNDGNTVTRTGVNIFSPFIVAVLGTPLPLKFGNISAARKNQVVNVQWEALSEENVAYYEVQKSSTGLSFNKAGVVNSLAHNLSYYKYGWTDGAPGNGTVFYRIKAVDNDGKYQYSSIVRVSPENGINGGIKVYPNPVQPNGRINVEAGTLSRGTYRVELTDMSGVRVYNRIIEHAGGSLTQNMELSKSLRTGTYILKFSGENVSYTSTVIVK